jgi:hypothetical protein
MRPPARSDARESHSLLALSILVPAESTATAVWLLLAGQRLLAGFAALVAAIVMVEVVPVLQGLRGRFIERLLDRVFEACLLAAVAWVWRYDSPAVSVAALIGLGASYLAGYERARGESLGYRGHEAATYRAFRHGLIVLALLTGWVHVFVFALAAVSLLAAGVRAANVAGQERRRQLEALRAS